MGKKEIFDFVEKTLNERYEYLKRTVLPNVIVERRDETYIAVYEESGYTLAFCYVGPIFALTELFELTAYLRVENDKPVLILT